MKRITSIAVAALALTSATPASAAFYMEGLKTFTQEPRCNDEYATDKRGCEKPDRVYPAPLKAPDKPDIPGKRFETREELDEK